MTRIAEIERRRGNSVFPEGAAATAIKLNTATTTAHVIHAIPDVLEAEGSALHVSKRLPIDGVEHAVNFDALQGDTFPLASSHDAQSAELGHSDAAQHDLDAMMLFDDDDTHHNDVTEEDMNAADLLSVSEHPRGRAVDESAFEDLSVDAVADEGIAHNRTLFADQESNHDSDEAAAASAGQCVFVDSAAANDGDGAFSYPAELEALRELSDNESALATVGDVELDEVAACDIAMNHEGTLAFADHEVDFLLDPLHDAPNYSLRPPPQPVATNVTLHVVPLPVVGMSYHADPSSILAATATPTQDEYDEPFSSITGPFQSGGIV
jgi:hypothetical protein